MDSRQDRIPTWVGRAVTTEELDTDSHVSVLTDDEDVPYGDEDLASSLNQSDSSASGPPKTTERSSTKHSRFAVRIGMLATVGFLAVIGSIAPSLPLGNDTVEVPTGASTAAESDSDHLATSGDKQPPTQSSDNDEAAVTVSTGKSNAEVSVADGSGAPTGSRTGAGVAPSSANHYAIPDMPVNAIKAHQQSALDDGQPAWAVYSDGRIYLQGILPGDAVADEIVGRLQALLGAGNVIAQYTIEPGATSPTDPPLFIKETVVFAPDSAAMPPGSDWILVIAGVLLNRYPTTDLTVVANGSNTALGITAELQLKRAEAVIAYLVDRGIEESRLDYEYRSGSSFGDNTGNKPIEFVVRGLIDEVG